MNEKWLIVFIVGGALLFLGTWIQLEIRYRTHDRELLGKERLAAIEKGRGLPLDLPPTRLSTWIFKVASRRIADYFRSPARRHIPSGGPGDATFPDGSGAARPGLEEETVQRTEEGRLIEALRRLGHPAGLILVSYYLGEMPVREIAHALKLPEGTVKTHLHRGRQALRDELGKR